MSHRTAESRFNVRLRGVEAELRRRDRRHEACAAPAADRRRDVHGNLNGLKDILEHAERIDASDRWRGGDAVLIQTGDVIDRGPDSRGAIRLLRRLQQESSALGAVVRLRGNHELLLLKKKSRCAGFPNPNELREELRLEVKDGNLLAAYTDGGRLYTRAGPRSGVLDALYGEICPRRGRAASRARRAARLVPARERDIRRMRRGARPAGPRRLPQ